VTAVPFIRQKWRLSPFFTRMDVADGIGATILIALSGAALIAATIFVYYAISYAVLFLIGKALPLVGRRRR